MGNNKPAILVVDDEPDLRSCLSELLEAEGYSVETASHGEEGWARLVACPDIGLILLDYMMPIMDARAFRQRQLKTAFGLVPTVILSAASIAAEVVAEMAPAEVLRKPVDIDQLMCVISRQLAD